MVLALENTGRKDSRKGTPGEQFTVTVDVAVSVPSTCVTLPKSMSVTLSAQPETTLSLTLMDLVEFAAWADMLPSAQHKTVANTAIFLALQFTLDVIENTNPNTF